MIVVDNGNICLYCFEEMGDAQVCPHCGHDEQTLENMEGTLAPGEILGGHYIVGRMLSQGSFGITYLAYDLDLREKCVIKEYFPQGLAAREGTTVKAVRKSVEDSFQKGVSAFCDEAQAAAQFSAHPNVVRVSTFFRENGTAYFVMDYVKGISFQEYLQDHGEKISLEIALRILSPIGKALSALHESHLLHRDVKPENISITQDGTPKLLDFGAARYDTSNGAHHFKVVLTPGYAPIEQYNSAAQQGPFTDVYALAATLYRSVSGITPESSTDRAVTDHLLPLNEVDPHISEGVGKAVSHAMSLKAADRTPSVEAFLQELNDAYTESSKVKTSDTSRGGAGSANVSAEAAGKTDGEPKRKKRKLFLIAAAAVLGIAIGLVVYFLLIAAPCGSMDQCYQAAVAGDSKAVSFIQSRAEKNDTDGQNYLGYMYENGYGVAQNYEEAVNWFRKSADQGNAVGQKNLGYMYENGLGVEKSPDEAVRLYQLSAEQGDEDAKAALTRLGK